MTEDEAQTKWCPMVRVRHVVADDDGDFGGDAVASNRTFTFTPGNGYTEVITNGNGYNCLGSGCMMWRRTTRDHPLIGGCGLAGEPVLK